MKKLFLQVAICLYFILPNYASTEVEKDSIVESEKPIALRNLNGRVQGGPFEIEPMTPSGELRGFTFKNFDGDLYKFFESREFKEGEPYHMLDYGCGTGRWSAMAALQGEMDKRDVAYTAIDPYMQDEHAEYYNQAWSTYINENGSAYGRLSVGRGVLRDIAIEKPKYNAVLVRDAIQLFSNAEVVELFQIGSKITHENGSIVVHATPPFATMFWNPTLKILMQRYNLYFPNFGEIFFNEGNFKAYCDFVAQIRKDVLGRMNQKGVSLPAIRNAAIENGWWLQTVQVGTRVMTHTKPLTEKHLYDFVQNKIMSLAPKAEEFGLEYEPHDPSIFLRFKKISLLQSEDSK